MTLVKGLFWTGITEKDLAGMTLATVIIYDNRELLITVTNTLPKPLKRVTLQQKNFQKKKEKGGT